MREGSAASASAINRSDAVSISCSNLWKKFRGGRPGAIGGKNSITTVPGRIRNERLGQKRPEFTATGITETPQASYSEAMPILYFGGAPAGRRVPSGKMKSCRLCAKSLFAFSMSCGSNFPPFALLIAICSAARRYQPKNGNQISSRLRI